EASHILEQGLEGGGFRIAVELDPCGSVLVPRGAGRLGQAVGIENEAAALDELDLVLGKWSVAYAKRESALGLQKTPALGVDEQRIRMPGIREDETAARGVEDRVDHRHEPGRGKIFQERAVDAFEDLTRRSAVLREQPEDAPRG